MTIIEQLARELDRPVEHIENVVRLLDEGNTIPFIARYRKELHGSMDDTALRTLEERLAYLRNLTERVLSLQLYRARIKFTVFFDVCKKKNQSLTDHPILDQRFDRIEQICCNDPL